MDLLPSGNRLLFKRKAILTAAGKTEYYLYFIIEWVQRTFYLGDDTKEATIVFTCPPFFGRIADSFLIQTLSL